ncbi:Purkinje cell protein 4-like protein 1 isoform X1 [Trachypithecus francoisi]|uniref:Purkinje cell protein 4-like protein 1 isoform X1 n=1 Tax=Trachypithecus francoisi TaxID=54180 RepID=UPI00141B7F98|nr:Purkinje cell protein 4-like protein 1 isoform X1 [Trachypithecus francoisi]
MRPEAARGEALTGRVEEGRVAGAGRRRIPGASTRAAALRTNSPLLVSRNPCRRARQLSAVARGARRAPRLTCACGAWRALSSCGDERGGRARPRKALCTLNLTLIPKHPQQPTRQLAQRKKEKLAMSRRRRRRRRLTLI